MSDSYRTADETYYEIFVPEKNGKGKGVKKGYFWVVAGINTRMIYLLHDDGFRSERAILNELNSCKDTIQNDGYSPYRKLESDVYPNIAHIPCSQHIKRGFMDCGEKNPDAKRIVELINVPYRNEHKHKAGVEKWMVEQNLMYRKKYVPNILGEIKDVLDETEEWGDLLPKNELQEAITYLCNEWNAMVDIFNYGDTYLDNNMVGRMNRCIPLSRKNSLFFGGRKGAERGAILYTIALTCRMHEVNLLGYLADVISRMTERQPSTSTEKYRELFPDRWEKVND